MCEIQKTETGAKMLVTTSGERFHVQSTGCDEGLAIFDNDWNYVTAIGLENPDMLSFNLTQNDIDVACAAVTSITTKRWLKNNKKRLETLKTDIREKMDAKGIKGEVLQPV